MPEVKLEDLSPDQLKVAIYDQMRVRDPAQRNINLLEQRLIAIENEKSKKLITSEKIPVKETEVVN